MSNLDLYFQEVKAYSLLTRAEECELARGIHANDSESLHKLVKANLRFVVSIAKEYAHYGVPLEDLINEGNLGLIKAAQRFDETRGFKFISYAVWWIKASIQDHVMRNWSMVRTGSTSSQKALFFNLRRVRAKFEREAGAAGETAPEPPSRPRIAALRRRFNDVGASNPFAVQELAAVKERLESLESQREDLEKAMREIPPGARDVFVLHDVEGLRHREIAELTGVASRAPCSKRRRAGSSRVRSTGLCTRVTSPSSSQRPKLVASSPCTARMFIVSAPS